ncbi:hypothetical protein BDD43_4084 [Mucilaginibacter gracilis]|uniref:Uncharacterized protein n=1 Tax=Mucilaginibacter gracilis TaxID=423350 RepID=A0A495J778_9SPHI|nr:hypothetical protein BDD43_4084 [Mucilaginibacter gracilis]
MVLISCIFYSLSILGGKVFQQVINYNYLIINMLKIDSGCFWLFFE